MDKFFEFMREGMDKGAKEYDEGSFRNYTLARTFVDMDEEIRDFANYAFILWNKLQELKNYSEKRIKKKEK